MTTDGATKVREMSDGLAAAVERAGASTVLVNARRRFPASGVAWSADGLVVTADHVIEHEDAIRVGLPDGSQATATLVGRDPGSDLALLRVEGATLTVPEFAPAGATRVGHLVLAVGRPAAGGVQASGGIVSAVGGPWRRRGGGQIEGYLRTDTTFFPGFSGGPLADVDGRVVGVNISLPRGGITIETPAVQGVVDLLLAHGRVRRAYLGIASQPVRLPDTAGGQESGLVLLSIEPGTPAAGAGLLVGDVLVGIEDAPVRDATDLQDALGPERVGATVRLRILRGGEPREVTVTLGERA